LEPTACPLRPTAPEEGFKALGQHAYLAVLLALMIAGTVLVISACYSRVIEFFPGGGGGYLVATKLLGPRFGVISGCALIVDYVLTISTSAASGVDQIQFAGLQAIVLPIRVLEKKTPLRKVG
jgi:amino acid transporter